MWECLFKRCGSSVNDPAVWRRWTQSGSRGMRPAALSSLAKKMCPAPMLDKDPVQSSQCRVVKAHCEWFVRHTWHASRLLVSPDGSLLGQSA